MIYREKKFENAEFVPGDILKDCLLIDCVFDDSVHLENCTVIESGETIEESTCVDCELDLDG